jgi:site-specific DNA recombinase
MLNRMIIEGTDPLAAPNLDPALIKAMLRAHRFHHKLTQGTAGRFAELARGEAMNRTYFARLLRLAYLAPDITKPSSTGANLPA